MSYKKRVFVNEHGVERVSTSPANEVALEWNGYRLKPEAKAGDQPPEVRLAGAPREDVAKS